MLNFARKETKPQAKPYRVLTIDGGGMRGLYTAILLDTLAARFAGPGHDHLDIGKGFDLIVGTSTGAILAIALAIGIPLREIVQLYRQVGPQIFQDPVPNHYTHQWQLFALWRWVWRNWRKSANKTDALRHSLMPYLGELSLGQMYQQRGIALCIPAVNMASHKGIIFKTPHNPRKTRDAGYSLLDVCMASISAPILFPLTTIDDPEDPVDYKTFVDGGLWANNPVLIGMAEALRMSQPGQAIEILSLSTCDPPGGTFIPKHQNDWGLNQWRVGTRVLSLALEAQSSAYHEMAVILADHLRQPCKVIRLPQSSPSAEQEKYLVMDQATPHTLKVLSDLAKQDAENIYRRALNHPEDDLARLITLFDNMPGMAKVQVV